MSRGGHRVIGGKLYEIPADTCAYCHAEALQHRRRPPVFHCDHCGRHIGRTRSVCLMDTTGPVVWCLKCRLGDGTEKWWNDHKPLVVGTQAGIRGWLRQRMDRGT